MGIGLEAMEWRRYDNGPLEDNDSLRTCFFGLFVNSWGGIC